MTDMEHRDTGMSAEDQARQRTEGAQDQARQRTEGAQDQARQRTEGAQDQAGQRMQGARQGEGKSATVPQARRSADERRGGTAGAESAGVGWMVYAGAVLIVLGGFQAIWGFTSLFNTTYFIVGDTALAVSFNYTAWAWIHIAIAVLLVCTGLAVLAGQSWARYVGIVLAVLAAFANFLALAAFPVWSVVMIAIDVLVIYALAVHGDKQMQSLRN